MKLIPKKLWQRIVLATVLLFVGTGGIIMASACATVGATPSGEVRELLKQSPNYKEDRFVNPLPMEDPKMGKALKEWIRGGKNTEPNEPVSTSAISRGDFDDKPGSGVRITWIGHSTSLVEIDGTRLLLDPVWSKRGSPFTWAGPKRFFEAPLELRELPSIDGILISHDHYDHLDKPTVEYLGDLGYRFIVPLGVGSRLQSWDIPAEQIVELDWWDETTVGNITVTATPARHFSGRSLVMADRDETLWSGFAMVGPTHRVYYTGDSGMFPGFAEVGKRLGPFDATLVEIGAYNKLWADYHLGPEQAVQAVQDARGGLLIPVHWATFDLAMHSWVEPGERLIVAAELSGQAVSLPRPGQTIDVINPPEVARWWPQIPWESATEAPVVSSGLEPRVAHSR
jgi:L-ascorbate metabolism protein UlaG (beta-lactamase superfamily)